MKPWVLCALLLGLAASAATAAPPSPGTVTRPDALRLLQNGGFGEAWSGVWDVRWAQVDCTTGLELFAITERDTLCPSDEVAPDGEFGDLSCSGTANDTEIHWNCSNSVTELGCTTTTAWSYDGTRTNDTFSAVIEVNITYEGDCEFSIPICIKYNYTGTRVGPAPVGACETPVEATHWGRLKSRY